MRYSQEDYDSLNKLLDNFNRILPQIQTAFKNVSDQFDQIHEKVVKIGVTGGKWLNLQTQMRRQLKQANKQFSNMSILGKRISDSFGFMKSINTIERTLQTKEFNGQLLKIHKNLLRFSTGMGKIAKDGKNAFYGMRYSLDSAQDALQDLNEKALRMAEINPVLAKQLIEQSQLLQVDIQLKEKLTERYQRAVVVIQGFNEAIDGGAKVLTTIQKGMSSFINSIGIAIPGVTSFINAFDVGALAQKSKTFINETILSVVSIRSSKGWKQILTGLGAAGMGLVKNLSGIFLSLVRGLVAGAIGAMAAIFSAGLSFYNQLQSKLIGFQNQTGALSGMQSKAWAAGGLDIYGAESAGALLSTFMTLQQYTDENAKHMSTMLLGAQVAQTDSAKVLQNFKLITGQTQSYSRDMEIVVANVAKQNKILPRKLMQDIANASQKVFKFSGGNAKELVRSALFAKKLQISMDDIANTAEGLLNIQQSISNAMQLQMLTGKSLNIQPAINMAAMGESQKAVAYIIDQLGSTMDTNNVMVLQSISKLTGMSIDKIKTVYNTLQKSGKSASQVLAQTGQSVTDSIDDKALKTKTAGQLTQLQAIERQIRFIMLNGAKPLIDFLFQNTPAIMQVVKAISQAVAKLSMQFIEFIIKKDGINQIKGAILKMIHAVQWGVNLVIKIDKWFDKAFGNKTASSIAKVTAALLVFSSTFRSVVWSLIKGISILLGVRGGGKWLAFNNLWKTGRYVTANSRMAAAGYVPSGVKSTPWRQAATGKFVSTKVGTAAGRVIRTGTFGKTVLGNMTRKLPIIGSLISAGLTAHSDLNRRDITAGQKRGRAIGSGAGTLVGGALGMAIAGPLGGIAGSIIGEMAGKAIGSGIGKLFSSKQSLAKVQNEKKLLEQKKLRDATLQSLAINNKEVAAKIQELKEKKSSLQQTRANIEAITKMKDVNGKYILTQKESKKIIDQLTKAQQKYQQAKQRAEINERLINAKTSAVSLQGLGGRSGGWARALQLKLSGNFNQSWQSMVSRATKQGIDPRVLQAMTAAWTATLMQNAMRAQSGNSSNSYGETFSVGGPVFGSGTSTSDSIPAFLSDGEYVVNAAATAKHYGMIDRINRGASTHDDRVPALLSALIAAVRQNKQIVINGRVVNQQLASSAGAARSVY